MVFILFIEIFDLKDYIDKLDYLQVVNVFMGLGMLGDGNIKCGFNFVWENFFKISLFNWIDLELERVVILLLSIVMIDNVVGIVVVVDKI